MTVLWTVTGVLAVACLGVLGLLYRWMRGRLRARRLDYDSSAPAQQILELLMERHAAKDEAQAWNSVLAAMDAMRRELDSYRCGVGPEDSSPASESSAAHLILRALPLGILQIDAGDRVVYANDAARRRLSLAAAADVAPRLAEQLRQPALVETILDLRHSVGAAGIDCAVQRGAARTIVRLTPLEVGTDSDDLVVSIEDISEVKQAERLRDEFLAHLTHELRTPLTSIRAYAETLSDDLFDDEQTRRECYHVIMTEAQRLSKLIEDVLTVSQIDAGAARLTRVRVQVDELLRQVVRELEAAADAKSLELTLEIPPNVPAIPGDRFRLYQVWTNVIGNAVKYTPAGGSVTVTLEWDARVMRVRVSDTGVGVAPQWRRKVFEKFFRIEDTALEGRPGTGLGLAIAQDVVRLHGGSIWMESALGAGATVVVELPIAGSAEGPKPLGRASGTHCDS